MRLALHPKAVALGNLAAHLIRLRFTGVSDDAIVVGTGDGPLVGVEVAREEVIPGLVPMVLLTTDRSGKKNLRKRKTFDQRSVSMRDLECHGR